jgi:transposase
MNFSSDCERFYTHIRLKLGEEARKIHDNLHDVYGDSCSSIHTITRWICQFNDGRENFKDDARSGGPKTAWNERNVMCIQEFIQENNHSNIVSLRV